MKNVRKSETWASLIARRKSICKTCICIRNPEDNIPNVWITNPGWTNFYMRTTLYCIECLQLLTELKYGVSVLFLFKMFLYIMYIFSSMCITCKFMWGRILNSPSLSGIYCINQFETSSTWRYKISKYEVGYQSL